MLPEFRGVDAGFLDLFEQDLYRVNIVQREQGGDANTPRHGWNERRHPVITVNDVRSHVGYDVVDDFTLEDQGAAHVVI